MNVLFKGVQVVDTHSTHHGEQVDVWVKDGKIETIGKELPADGEVVQYEGACLSPGFFDLGAQGCDPGFEHREDLQSLAQAATKGGFTGLAIFPNTQPTLHSKSEVLYIKNSALSLPVDIHAIGAISEKCAGKDITEMLDMHAAGAVAFSDGAVPVASNGLMLRALLYVKAFSGLVINQAMDYSISRQGQMHEGFVSTSLGMQGFPNLAESIMVTRDLSLLEYTDSRLHLFGISTKEAVGQVRQAKESGLKVTASVPVANLVFTDEVLGTFDSNYKVMPPLRSESDREALIEGLVDGTIDMIVSNHVPWDEEGKKLEFPYAQFGMLGLETAFSLAWQALAPYMDLGAVIRLLSGQPRKILQMHQPVIQENLEADLVLYHPAVEWELTRKDLGSKALNTPLLGQALKGKVLATYSKGRLIR